MMEVATTDKMAQGDLRGQHACGIEERASTELSLSKGAMTTALVSARKRKATEEIQRIDKTQLKLEAAAREKRFRLRREHEAYHAMLADGGRPTHRPHDQDSKIFESPADRPPIIEYWISQISDYKYAHEVLLYEQEDSWQVFRKKQNDVREQYKGESDRLDEHSKKLNEYRAKHGLQGTITLCADLSRQSRLDTWKEYETQTHMRSYPCILSYEEDQAKVKELEEDLQRTAESGALWGVILTKAKAVSEARRGRWRYRREWREEPILLQWLADQIPLIEAEEAASKGKTCPTTQDQDKQGAVGA